MSQNSSINSNTDSRSHSGHLFSNLILFGRLLRGLSLDVNTGRLIDLAQALDHIKIARKVDFYHAARSLLVHRHEDFPLFDAAFEAFWRRPVGNRMTLDLGAIARKARRRSRKPIITAPPLKQSLELPLHRKVLRDDQPPVVQVTLTYSAREALRHKDFADLSIEELAAIRQMMSALRWRPGRRRTRRPRAGRGHLFDLRRTLRRSLRHGGEVLEWSRRAPQFKPRPLVVIADVSGSMERYTRLLLHFIYGLTAGLEQPVESFVFSTRLTRITRQLRRRDVERALREVSNAVKDWSGGTRIGEALKRFNFDWGRRVLGRGSVVLLISDGWDRGDVDLLRAEMARLQRSCHRLIWLNPLLGSPQYEPLTRGMQAALPYADDFLPIHNLASLEDLAGRLSELSQRAPVRRQQARV